MKYGVNLWLWQDAFRVDENLFSQIKRMGFDGVEIPLNDPDTFNVHEIKKALNNCGLEMLFTGVFGSSRDLISDDTILRKNAFDYIRKSIEIVSSSGTDVFSGPMYSSVGKLIGRGRTQKEWERCINQLKELGKISSDNGITLAIEILNRFEVYFLNTAEDAKKLLDEVNSLAVKVHIDSFHMHIEEKNIYSAVHSLGDYVYHVHCSENDRGIPGSGQVDWGGFFKALKNIGYDRWLVIESFVPGVKEIAKAASIWRDIAPDSDTLAQKGLSFIKAKFAVS